MQLCSALVGELSSGFLHLCLQPIHYFPFLLVARFYALILLLKLQDVLFECLVFFAHRCGAHCEADQFLFDVFEQRFFLPALVLFIDNRCIVCDGVWVSEGGEGVSVELQLSVLLGECVGACEFLVELGVVCFESVQVVG